MLLPYFLLQENVPVAYHRNTARTTEERILYHTYLKLTGALERSMVQKYGSDEDFSFPLVTTIPFDYCFQEGEQENLLKSFESAEVVGVLSDEEYINLIYAFFKSPLTPRKYIPIFERILEVYYKYI